MPDEASHITLANRCQQAMLQLLEAQPVITEWVATIAFYKALHVIEAVFFHDPEIVHGGDHGLREKHLNRNRRYRAIHMNYQLLLEASMVARYLVCKAPGVTSFNQYMSLEAVRQKLIAERLHRIECEALKLLKDPGALTTVASSQVQLGITDPLSPPPPQLPVAPLTNP